jgi:hypothetical protein
MWCFGATGAYLLRPIPRAPACHVAKSPKGRDAPPLTPCTLTHTHTHTHTRTRMHTNKGELRSPSNLSLCGQGFEIPVAHMHTHSRTADKQCRL